VARLACFPARPCDKPSCPGVDDKTIQAILRHSNIGITQNIYIKSVTELQVNVMDTLGEKLGICNDYATPRQKRPN
jgi:hypothetical protein